MSIHRQVSAEQQTKAMDIQVELSEPRAYGVTGALVTQKQPRH